ncbi:MAG: alpha/beta hydrolase family protein [Myxococcota bacterium]
MRWLDLFFARARRRATVFRHGWGDRSLLESEPTSLLEPWPRVPFGYRGGFRLGGFRCDDWEARSPEVRLPPTGRRFRLRRLAPHGTRIETELLLLGSWGDEDFDLRRKIFAPLLLHSPRLALLFLEMPLYGRRRRLGQRGPNLLRVSDLILLGRTAIREARACLLFREAFSERLAVAGFSMGGQLAAKVAAVTPRPIGVAAIAPALHPAAVFIDGPLRREIDFAALGPDGERHLAEILRRQSVAELPSPAAPSRAVVVATRHDAIVPPANAVAIARHWRVRPRWLEHGHVSAVLRGARVIRAAVHDCL